MNETVTRVSPSRLATYAACPRQYEYDSEWSVEAPEESRRYLDRGLAYHGAIEDTCTWVADHSGSPTDEEIRAYAAEAIDRQWTSHTDRSEYASDAQYAYDREVATTGVAAYFAEDGLEHARNSVTQEGWLTCNRGDVHLHGRVDNIVRTDDGLQVIDYKGSLSGIVSGRTHDRIEEHHDGEAYHADILRSVFQAATYIEGAKRTDHYEPGMDVEFTFYGLLHSVDRNPGRDGITVTVEANARNVGWIYDAHEDAIWSIIEDCYDGILDREFAPEPWDEIQEQTYGDCSYQGMCGDYLGAEVGLDD
ncbi:PD-(D/E)XK nuclease family protein [Halorubellus sp. JP-L1]|uniref:PD-(D/E)XK nuclease family protein n=1 Tax=Halorubellus sp. JP-L1 TaxID=2715753 RepID=UPI00140CE633|nr:PD-(D/E)XK nuclease family protein [Halorubellus sp. JP-L1]